MQHVFIAFENMAEHQQAISGASVRPLDRVLIGAVAARLSGRTVETSAVIQVCSEEIARTHPYAEETGWRQLHEAVPGLVADDTGQVLAAYLLPTQFIKLLSLKTQVLPQFRLTPVALAIPGRMLDQLAAWLSDIDYRQSQVCHQWAGLLRRPVDLLVFTATEAEIGPDPEAGVARLRENMLSVLVQMLRATACQSAQSYPMMDAVCELLTEDTVWR